MMDTSKLDTSTAAAIKDCYTLRAALLSIQETHPRLETDVERLEHLISLAGVIWLDEVPESEINNPILKAMKGRHNDN
jgi:hypothetical protein